MEEITARMNPENRNILVTHYFMTDGASLDELKTIPERCDSEQTMTIGGVDNVNSARLDGFDYVALGHLHRAQQSRREAVRYSGSPLKYSFSEEKHEKTVTLINLLGKEQMEIIQKPIAPARDMVTIQGFLSDMLSADSNFRRHSGDYVQAILTDPPGISEPMAKLRSVYPNTLKVCFKEENFQRTDDRPALERLQKMSPEIFFEEYYKAMRGCSMSEKERRVLHTVIQKAEGGMRSATDLTDDVGL